jgi:hypothetical protein
MRIVRPFMVVGSDPVPLDYEFRVKIPRVKIIKAKLKVNHIIFDHLTASFIILYDGGHHANKCRKNDIRQRNKRPDEVYVLYYPAIRRSLQNG